MSPLNLSNFANEPVVLCRCLLVSVHHRSCSPSRLEADAAVFDDEGAFDNAAEHDDHDEHGDDDEHDGDDEPPLQHGGIQSAPAPDSRATQPPEHTAVHHSSTTGQAAADDGTFASAAISTGPGYLQFQHSHSAALHYGSNAPALRTPYLSSSEQAVHMHASHAAAAAGAASEHTPVHNVLASAHTVRQARQAHMSQQRTQADHGTS